MLPYALLTEGANITCLVIGRLGRPVAVIKAFSTLTQRRLGDYTGMHCVSLLFTIAIFDKRLVKSC